MEAGGHEPPESGGLYLPLRRGVAGGFWKELFLATAAARPGPEGAGGSRCFLSLIHFFIQYVDSGLGPGTWPEQDG